MTYYKYAERSVDSQINWAKVGKDMTDMLKTQIELREQKKAALDKTAQDIGQKLTNAPMGESDLANDFTQSFVDDAKAFLLMLDDLLKSGLISSKEYLTATNNLNIGTDNLYNLTKEYQDQYTKAMKRREEGDSQYLEIADLASVEGYAKLGNHKAYINPTTGALAVGEMVPGEDGVMQMNSPISLSELRNRIISEYDVYDINGSVNKLVNSLGAKVKFKELETQYGTTIYGTEENLTSYPKYTEWLDTAVQGLTSVDTQKTSILTENLGMASNGKMYNYVEKTPEGKFRNIQTGEISDKQEEHMIAFEINKNTGGRDFLFTEDQEIAIDTFVRDEIRAQIPFRQEYKVKIEPPKPSPSELKLQRELDETETNVQRLADLYFGDAGDISVAEVHFRDVIEDETFGAPSKVQKTATGIKLDFIVSEEDGKEGVITKTIPFGETFEDFVIQAGPLLLGETNVEDKVTISDFIPKDDSGVSLPFSTITGTGASEGIGIPRNTFVPNDENETEENIKLLFSQTPGMSGYKVEQVNVGRDMVAIIDPSGNEIDRLDLDAAFSANDYIDRLQKIIDAAQAAGPINYAEK